MMTVLNAAVNAAMPIAWASLFSWFSWLGGGDMARRRFIRALTWACTAAVGVLAAAVSARPWGAAAAGADLAIGLVLLGRVAARKARQS